MKFRRTEAAVDVGYIKPDAPPGAVYGVPSPFVAAGPMMQVIEENGRAFPIPFEQFVEQYEPADDMAQAFLEGLQERAVEMRRPPGSDFDPADIGYDVTDGEGQPVMRMRPVKGKKKKR
jgi:hypothetical protein